MKKIYIYQILTLLYQLSHLHTKIRIHFHSNSWPTFVHTFQCLLTHTVFWTWHIFQAFILFTICRARKVRTPPHVLHWPTFFKPVNTLHLIMLHDQHWQHCPLLASVLFYYCLLFLAMLWDAQFSEVFHELQRASSNLDRKWVKASCSDISITWQRKA